MSNQVAVTNQQVGLKELADANLPIDVKSALTTLLARVPHKIEESNWLTSVFGKRINITFGDGSSLHFYGKTAEVLKRVGDDLVSIETDIEVVKWLPVIIKSLEGTGELKPLYYIGLKESGLTVVQISDSQLAELPENTVFPEGFETEEAALEHIKNIDLDELARENPLAAVYMKPVVATIGNYLEG